MKKVLGILMVLLVVGMAGCVKDDVNYDSKVKVGDRLPVFSVVTDGGERVSNESLKGAPAAVMFFHTGCPDCQRELPVVQELSGMVPELRVVCIARSEGAAEIAAYWEANSLTLPYSAQEGDGVYRLFADAGIPRLYLTDAAGTVVAEFCEEFPAASRMAALLRTGAEGRCHFRD